MMLKEVTSETPEERLAELGLELPPVPEAVADYVTHTQIGPMVLSEEVVLRQEGRSHSFCL